jgi:hypothetical protein
LFPVLAYCAIRCALPKIDSREAAISLEYAIVGL